MRASSRCRRSSSTRPPRAAGTSSTAPSWRSWSSGWRWRTCACRGCRKLDHVANYPIVRKLGEGATSEVFLCQDPFRGRQVAVKRIFPEALRDPTRGRLFRKLFFTEASLAGKLQHPHVAQIFDAGIGEDSAYIVLEDVPGGTMERFCAPENLLPIEQVLEIAFKCARALAFAHTQGVTHRDIKPGNILYAASPADVRIGDFGLAIHLGSETTQVTG